MLEASSDGVFSSLAHLLSRELSWNLAPEEAREWLRAISNFVGARLLIAIDGIDEAFPKLRNDIFEIVSGGFGPSLGIVVAVDDTVKQVITRSQNGREKNVLGRAAIEISVEPLDDEEFELALGVLAENKIQVTRGGESVQALREPWIIRALVPPQISDRPEDANWYVRIPPLLDVDSLGVAGSAIQNSSDTEAALRLTARAILEEYLGERKASAIIHGLSTFIVGKVTLENAVGQYSLEDLLQRGYLKAGLDQSGSPVWFIRVPALMANHVSFVIAEMICEWGEAKDVAKRLISLSTRLPFGDVVVAHALVECAKNGTTRNLYGVIAALLEDAPVTSSLAPGSKLLLKLNGTPLQVSVTSSGFVLPNGETIEVPSDELGKLTSFGGWLILSHLASVAIAVKQGSAAGVRMDPGLLEVVGASWSVLVRPDGGSLVREVAIHEIAGRGSAVCHLAGVVEPVTWAFVRLFSRIGDEELAEEFVQFAIEQNSMPLLLRISNALTETRQLAGNQGEWAKETLARRVLPLIRAFPGH